MTTITIQKNKQVRSENDSAWKDFLDVYFKECMEFLYNDLYLMIDWSKPYEMLDSELQAITSEKMQGKKFVDKLIRVKTKDNRAQILEPVFMLFYPFKKPQRMSDNDVVFS